ncbi:uncharacterized protein A4U43_C06F14000 [Asparagus officinalis]|uniref:Uncharacterized protein n=1 Tax=Asparagus officinalis TaxID=4686 RepID=A0A5P1ELS2_ASPOF|nr:uncharacterized protein A4U43_C06F14000 [Asparagus officinalis]
MGRERREERVCLGREERSGPRSEKDLRAHSRSKPLEKNLPSPAITRAEGDFGSDLICVMAEWREEMRVGLRRCSVAPVKVLVSVYFDFMAASHTLLSKAGLDWIDRSQSHIRGLCALGLELEFGFEFKVLLAV